MKRQALISSELAFDPGEYRLERTGKIFRLIAAGLRHIGSSATTPAALLGHEVGEIPGTDAFRLSPGHPGDY